MATSKWRPREIIAAVAVGLLSLGWTAIVVGLLFRNVPLSTEAIAALVAIPGIIARIVRSCFANGKSLDK